MYPGRMLNMVLGGGGVKGIAYIGVFEAIDKKGFLSGNMSGVSAGALAGSFAGAGYSPQEMWGIMDSFDFEGIQLENAARQLPVVADFIGNNRSLSHGTRELLEAFLIGQSLRRGRNGSMENLSADEQRIAIIDSIVTYSKKGALFDGDYLEEWVSKVLAQKGIRTFADLRGGVPDETNPRGYRVRMTGVDCSRMKVVVLPDDAIYYGINPDRFEVAKAVRISTCVPFAFKPVQITWIDNGRVRTHNLVDGGVLDSFPFWLIGKDKKNTVGFKLNGTGKNKLFSLDTALAILKALISVVHDIGVPKNAYGYPQHVADVDTGSISFLDFNLDDKDKVFLYNSGKKAALELLEGMTKPGGANPFYK